MNNVLVELNLESFPSIEYTEKEGNDIVEECLKRCSIYGSEKIISSICERKNNFEKNNIVDNSQLWLEQYKNKVSKKYDFSLFVLNINQNDFRKNNYDIDFYCKMISLFYDKLENYRYLVIKIEGDILDENDVIITWNLAYKLSIYCENFILYKEDFGPFKKEKSISKLVSFLDERFSNNNNLEIVEEFYKGISTGFKFEDCYIEEEQKNIIITFKKIVLDKSPVPCPSCMTTIQSGNSYPELFLRSYECKNPNCPDRSKSGRGKRFDEFGVYRYFKLVEDFSTNKIDYNLYNSWRRDIYSKGNDVLKMLVKYYTWDNETIYTYNYNTHISTDRKIVNCEINEQNEINDYIKSYNDLLIVKFFKNIEKLIQRKTGNKVLSNNLEVINGNSSVELRCLKSGQIGSAITSPPYYNAREYSQWSTLIMYLIDMMINSASVYDSLVNESFYLYNIGDIVNSDNIYVESNMSKRRLQLGFLSSMIFEINGFKLVGNIIWDKGQVQSKRNSTVNLNSGYVKCINCYEHVLVFKKGKQDKQKNHSFIKHFSPVIKINSKGENLYKHTAPYPLDMIELLVPYIKPDKYILDPFLGSGTTLKWCKEHNVKVMAITDHDTVKGIKQEFRQ